MSFQRSSLRYAHTNGHTSLVYTEHGDNIITCGSDGDIRRWTSISDDDPTSNCLGEFVMSIAHKGEQLLAATDRNTIQAYTFPAMDNDGTLLRFTAPATCLRVSGKYIAAGSDDTKIKVKVGEGGNILELTKHSGPVLSLDVYAPGNLLASIAGDGQLKLWNLDDAGAELKSISGLAKVNSFENATCFGTPNFEPVAGKELAYVHGKEIVVLSSTNSWDTAYTLSDERAKSNYSCCQYSPDGQKLAAGTTGGELCVFDVRSRRALKVQAPPSDCKAITCIAWNPANNDEVAFCDATGQLGTIYLVDDNAREDADAVEMETNELLGNDFGDIEFEDDNDADDMLNGEAMERGVDDAEEDDDENAVSLEKLKQKVMSNAIRSATPDLDDEDSKHSMRSSVQHMETLPTLRTFKQQTAFQPSATPIDLEHRYLVWNGVGIVTAHADLSADGSIDVEFHDASVHHSLHITNYQQHNMASLSSAALALSATDSTKLVVIALAASGNKEWSISLPDCESVEALVATTKLVAAATSSHFLRIFSVMGTQREVLSIPGAVVALAGHEHNILVVYHAAPSGAQQQHLAAMFVYTSGLTLRVQQLPLPLTPGRQLTWLGFSDCGSPAFSDNMGLVQLYQQKCNAWFPICDTMKQSASVSNNYFIISISERTQIMQAVLCRGTSYPMTNPRPMLQELSMQLPFCDLDTEKSELEDSLMRAAIMQVDNSDKVIKETAIKLFALACRSELESRAKELIETISCTELLQLAVKYATKLGRIHLSDRLCDMLPQLELEQELRKEQQAQHAGAFITPIYMPATPTANVGNRLAPKTMELSASKRSTLKRFSQREGGASSPNLFKQNTLSATPKPSNPLDTQLDTQENVYNSGESQLDSPSLSSTAKSEKEQRTPLNSVNPFAMKRKLADTGVLFGSEKLKLAKK